MAAVSEKQLRHEYAQLREKAYNRNRNLKNAGFNTYDAPKVRDLNKEQIKKETKKLEKWLNSPQGTVRGARLQQQEKERRREEQRERRREYDRERYERKRQENPPKERPPRLTDEERRQRHNEQNRQYRLRVKLRKEAELREQNLQRWIDEQPNAQGYRNLLSGLRKYGVKVTDPRDLDSWMKYVQERKKDSDRDFYRFDVWVEDVLNATNKLRQEDPTKVDADSIYNMLLNYEEWKSDQGAMLKEFTRPTGAGDFAGYDLMSTFLESSKWMGLM